MTGLHSAVATFRLASVTDALPAQKTPAAIVPSLRILFLSDVLTPGPTLSSAGSREFVAMGPGAGHRRRPGRGRAWRDCGMGQRRTRRRALTR
jgi:hypothetical protein